VKIEVRQNYLSKDCRNGLSFGDSVYDAEKEVIKYEKDKIKRVG
jgi:hypothetical protein